jgi:hypothetical protein
MSELQGRKTARLMHHTLGKRTSGTADDLPSRGARWLGVIGARSVHIMRRQALRCPGAGEISCGIGAQEGSWERAREMRETSLW